MERVLVDQIKDRAAVDAFRETRGDDQLGFVRLKSGAYGVMTEDSLRNISPHSIRIWIIDGSQALNAIGQILGFAGDEYTYLCGNGRRHFDAKLYSPCNVLSGLKLITSWEPRLFGKYLMLSNDDPDRRRGVWTPVPLEVARPWRAAYRKRCNAFGLSSRNAKLAMLESAIEFWSAEFDRVKGEVISEAHQDPATQQPHGHTYDEGTI